MKDFKKIFSLFLIFLTLESFNSALSEEIKILPPVSDPNFYNSIKNTDSNLSTPKELPVLIEPSIKPEQPLKTFSLSVPAGTVFPIMTLSTVSSSENQIGEIFISRLVEPITLNGNIVIPVDSCVVGQIVYVEKPGRLNKQGALEIKFINIKLPDNSNVPISAKLMTKDNTGILKNSNLKKQLIDATYSEAITTTSGLFSGMALGAIANATAAGAAVGSGFGAILGVGWLFGRKGNDIIIKRNTRINAILDETLTTGK